MVGHTLGAAGAISAARGRARHPRRRPPADDQPGRRPIRTATSTTCRTRPAAATSTWSLVNGFGFGGQNAVSGLHPLRRLSDRPAARTGRTGPSARSPIAAGTVGSFGHDRGDGPAAGLPWLRDRAGRRLRVGGHRDAARRRRSTAIRCARCARWPSPSHRWPDSPELAFVLGLAAIQAGGALVGMCFAYFFARFFTVRARWHRRRRSSRCWRGARRRRPGRGLGVPMGPWRSRRSSRRSATASCSARRRSGARRGDRSGGVALDVELRLERGPGRAARRPSPAAPSRRC